MQVLEGASFSAMTRAALLRWKKCFEEWLASANVEKITHTKPLPLAERRGELSWLSLRVFPIGNLLSWVDMSSRGESWTNRAGYSRMALLIHKLVMALLGGFQCESS
jgi:hypothetical protein